MPARRSFEHAKALAAEIGFELVDTFTGGGSDGNFTAAHTATLDGLGVDGKGAHTHYEQLYISSLEPRARLLLPAVPDAAMTAPSAIRTERDGRSDDGAARHAQGSFFGRRKGHKLRAHQADLIEHLLPHLALDIETAAPSSLSGAVRSAGRRRCGSRSVSAAASIWSPRRRRFPHTGFIGCEPYVNGMAKILAQIEAHNIGNIRLFAGDAAELLAWLPPQSLARIDLIHPDPWPKRRHWKRRFVQDATITAMARVLEAAAANSASSATSTTTAPGRCRICCARRIFAGSRSAPTTGVCPGTATP